VRIRVGLACLAAVLGAHSAVGAQLNLRELARERALREPGSWIGAPPSSPGHFDPRTIEDLTRDSDVVVRATLRRPYTYLAGENESLLFTDYAIEDATVLAGALESYATRTPGDSTPPLLLTVWGGDLTIDGIRIHGPDSNFLTPQDGGVHLLFLRVSRAKQPGKYEVWHAGIFELSGEQLKPLLRRDDGLRVFGWAAEMRVSDALARIRGVRR
jgi:hypothetical protein